MEDTKFIEAIGIALKDGENWNPADRQYALKEADDIILESENVEILKQALKKRIGKFVYDISEFSEKIMQPGLFESERDLFAKGEALVRDFPYGGVNQAVSELKKVLHEGDLTIEVTTPAMREKAELIQSIIDWYELNEPETFTVDLESNLQKNSIKELQDLLKTLNENPEEGLNKEIDRKISQRKFKSKNTPKKYQSDLISKIITAKIEKDQIIFGDRKEEMEKLSKLSITELELILEDLKTEKSEEAA